jgi:hypothetical protein
MRMDIGSDGKKESPLFGFLFVENRKHVLSFGKR